MNNKEKPSKGEKILLSLFIILIVTVVVQLIINLNKSYEINIISPKDDSTLLLNNITVDNHTFEGVDISDVFKIEMMGYDTHYLLGESIELSTNSNKIKFMLIGIDNNSKEHIIEFGNTLNLSIGEDLIPRGNILYFRSTKYKLLIIREDPNIKQFKLQVEYTPSVKNQITLNFS